MGFRSACSAATADNSSPAPYKQPCHWWPACRFLPDAFAGVGWLLGPLKRARELCRRSKHLCSRTTHAALWQLPNPEDASAWACTVQRWAQATLPTKLQPTAASQTLDCHELAF